VPPIGSAVLRLLRLLAPADLHHGAVVDQPFHHRREASRDPVARQLRIRGVVHLDRSGAPHRELRNVAFLPTDQ
jgi:hypothetical protein